MSRSEILKKLNVIFNDVFDDEEAMISETTKPEDIENWDSIGQVYLMVEIEDEFKIQLGETMEKVENVAMLIDIIENKIKENKK